MSIASEITRLQNAKADIKTAIEVKGVTIPSNATLDEYSDYVEEISTGITPTGTINITENGTSDVTNYASANVNVQPDLETKSITITENTTTTITPTQGKDGLSSVQVTTNVSGGETIDTLAKLNAKAQEYLDYLIDLPNHYSSSTTERKTLYTPIEGYSQYLIGKRVNGKYRIYWIPQGTVLSRYDRTLASFWLSVLTTHASNIENWDNEITIARYRLEYYQSGDFSTIEGCVSAMQNTTTTYTKSSSSIYTADNTPYVFPFSNAVTIDYATKIPLTTQKISSNETIEVIPTT